MPKPGRPIRFFGIGLIIFLADFITKSLIRSRLPMGDEIPLLPFFSIVHLTNTGIAFGMFQGRNTFFLVLGILMLGVIGYLGLRILREDPVDGYVLAGVLGGAAGNILDRILFGRVTDFLDFFWGAHHWPAFNLADSAICVGAFALLARGLLKGRS